MLIKAALLSLVCSTALRKYDFCKYLNTFKARSQTSVNKHNSTCGMCYCGMQLICNWYAKKDIPTYCNWYDQEGFTWHEIWRKSFYLFKVRWNDHSVSYFSLWKQYKYTAFDILSCRILVISYNVNHYWNF